MGKIFNTETMYEKDFTRINLRNSSRRKPTMRTHDHLQKVKHEQFENRTLQKGLQVDIHKFRDSIKSLNEAKTAPTDSFV